MRGALFKHAAIIATALLVLLPALLHPPMLNDSFWIDWVWADQFNAALRRGVLYPRWLPLSHGGLGSPVFYFYPPLAFYVSGAFGLLGLSTYASIIAAFASGLVASGYTMFAWLKGQAKYPLLGAILYMVAPYHLLDFYGRGALAEFMAIALIPLIALGIRERRPALLAVSWAALLLTHLPLALLVGVFLIVPYSLWSRPGFRWMSVNLLAGIGLAAIYLIPAFALDPYRDGAALWYLSAFRPESWSVWAWTVPGPKVQMRIVVLAIVLAMMPPLWLLRRQKVLAAYGLICCLLALGLIPGIWQLPGLEKVQFPFRILGLVEFAVATGIAKLDWSRPYGAVAAIPALTMSVLMATSLPHDANTTLQRLEAFHPDVPENLPPGNHPRTWPSLWALDLAKANPGSVFYFPGLTCRNPPDTVTMLVPGCDGRTRPAAPEKGGLLISLLTAFLLIVSVVRRRWRSGIEGQAFRRKGPHSSTGSPIRSSSQKR